MIAEVTTKTAASGKVACDRKACVGVSVPGGVKGNGRERGSRVEQPDTRGMSDGGCAHLDDHLLLEVAHEATRRDARQLAPIERAEHLELVGPICVELGQLSRIRRVDHGGDLVEGEQDLNACREANKRSKCRRGTAMWYYVDGSRLATAALGICRLKTAAWHSHGGERIKMCQA